MHYLSGLNHISFDDRMKESHITNNMVMRDVYAVQCLSDLLKFCQRFFFIFFILAAHRRGIGVGLDAWLSYNFYDSTMSLGRDKKEKEKEE